MRILNWRPLPGEHRISLDYTGAVLSRLGMVGVKSFCGLHVGFDGFWEL